jgi:hypothetical protein
MAWRHRPRRPDWLSTESPLYEAYRDRALLLEQGQVVWGHVVQANEELLSPGRDPFPAALLFSLDPAYADRVGNLGEIAKQLFELKGYEVDDQQMDRFASAITDETTPLLNERVPLESPASTEILYTSIVIDPRNLPQRHLVLSWFPILVAPTLSRGCTIVDRRYWSSFLRSFWTASWS